MICISVPCFGAVNFDGTDDYIDCNADNSLQPTSFTLSLWINCEGNSDDAHSFLAGSLDDSKGFELMVANTTYNVWWAHSQNFAINGIGVSLILNEWYHFVFVYDENVGTFVYSNGVLQDTDGNNGAMDYSGSPEFWIGERQDNFGATQGTITEVALWNIALTASESRLLYTRIKGMPLQVQYDNLVGYWPLDDHAATNTAGGANGLIFKDVSSENNNGTASGGKIVAEEVLSYP